MKKKLLLVFLFVVSLLFIDSINAETICKYLNSSGNLSVEVKINDKNKITSSKVTGYLSDYYLDNASEDVDNWGSKPHGTSQSAKEYFETAGKCPPTAIVMDRVDFMWLGNKVNLFLTGNNSDQAKLINSVRKNKDKAGYDILSLVDQNLVGKSYNIKFVKNKPEATGTMADIKAKYGENAYIPKTEFKLPGFSVVGYHVKNNGKWLCKGNVYKENCDAENDSYNRVSDDSAANIYFDPSYPTVELFAIWEPNDNIDSQTINYYNLGEGKCTDSGFVWVETNGGYCNTDKLQYVTCGNSYDIPIEVPELISYFVNILKIATPIILIIVSIVALLKALSASNEDEIKKAQKLIVRKITAGAMVFFVITIVQFVVFKVADSSETKSLSDCMSCFLNNDCTDNTYYKTNIGGTYFCTEVLDIGTKGMESCTSYYQTITSKFK